MERHSCKYAPFEMEADKFGYWVKYEDAESTRLEYQQAHRDILAELYEIHVAERKTITSLYVSVIVLSCSLLTSIIYLLLK
jgi:hypothetical protein